MSWVIFAVLAALCFGSTSVLMGTSAAGKLDPATTSFVNALFAALVGGIWVFLEKGFHKVMWPSLMLAILSGIFGGVAGIMFCKMAATGTNLSVSIAVVRVGTVVVATLLGVILLKEGLSPRALVGLVLSLTGLFLLLGAK